MKDTDNDQTAAPWNYGADPRVIDLKESVQDEWLARPGVRGVGVTLDEDGRNAISVLLDEGTPEAGLELPPTVQDVKVLTRAIVIDPVGGLASPTTEISLKVEPDTGKYDPLEGGISISSNRQVDGNLEAGTLGVVLEDRASGQQVAVSAYHVLYTRGEGNDRDPIFQPIYSYTGFGEIGAPLRFYFGNFEMHYPRNKKNVGLDAAVASVEGRGASTRDIVEAGHVMGWAEPRLNAKVGKRGFRTRRTEGRVSDVCMTLPTKVGQITKQLENQFVIARATADPFEKPGDSGSVVFESDGPELTAVGLVWGGGYVPPDQQTTYGFASPFPAVVEALSLK
jgi:hypothetical protein